MAKTTPPAAITAARGRTIRLIDMAVMMLTRLPDRWLVRTLYRLKQAGYWFAPGKRKPFRRLTSLQPADAPEPPEQACAYQQDRADYAKIAVLPLQFRHVLEVHAVDAGDRCRHRDDGEP